MFEASIYRARRNRLRELIGNGVVLLMGNSLQPRPYPANTYPFRQSSHFMYYAGLADPDLVVLIHMDSEREVLFGNPVSMDDIIWSGELPGLEERAASVGLTEAVPLPRLVDVMTELGRNRTPVHYLAPFQADAMDRMQALWGMDAVEVRKGESNVLKRAVVEQRLHKSTEEVAEIEDALGVTASMYALAMSMVRPGVREMQIAGAMQGLALSHDRQQSFLPIVTVRGQILHNETYGNTLEAGQILLVDSGAESPIGYSSDITRAIPVSGRFTPTQRQIYEIVLAMQTGAIEAARPGITNLELHMGAARTCVAGLIDMGLMKGDPDEAARAGAHALFFPHGLGHMLGIDVHDMEDLGDIVGYGEGESRSSQFGLAFLRMARKLETGFVFTVEPGIYFVPALIDEWRARGLHAQFIDYDAVQRFRKGGGIRIEDDVLVTEDGHRVLGPHIPKTVGELEAATGR